MSSHNWFKFFFLKTTGAFVLFFYAKIGVGTEAPKIQWRDIVWRKWNVSLDAATYTLCFTLFSFPSFPSFPEKGVF